MGKPLLVLSRQQIIDIFNNSVIYEILFTFGVPIHDPHDYCNWEAINFNRMAHARLLYAFLETPTANRYQDDVLAEDFGYPASPIPLPQDDRLRLNKDLMHLTFARLRHTPATKPWPDSILATLVDPVLGFMRHVETQRDLFPAETDVLGWRALMSALRSGKQMIITCAIDAAKRPTYRWFFGADLPSGKPALTKFGRPL